MIKTDDPEKHNGWTNRETWAVHLYLNNGEDSYEAALGMRDEANNQSDRDPLCAFADALKEWFEDMQASTIDGKVHRDTIMMLFDIGSLWRVNWYEVAESFGEEVEQP